MKVHLLPFLLFTTVAAGYHEEVGIPAASVIWDLENGLDCSTRITNGLHSAKWMHPFVGGLIITLASYGTSVCGSTLLSKTKLVTAAHCGDDGVHYATEFLVVLGSVKLFSGGKRIVTDQIEIHYAYNPYTVHNDIAIITVPPVSFTLFISPINLPEGDLLNRSFVGEYGRVVGYGKISDSENIVLDQSLRYAVVTVKPSEHCRMFGEYFSPSMICSNSIFGGPCGGDSGGPLYIHGDCGFKKYLIGIVSYGSPLGCNARRPNVYTRISSYIDWIKNRL